MRSAIKPYAHTPIILPPRNPMFVRTPSELCTLATRWDGDVPEGGLIVQEKIDGWRALWIDGELVTRGGMPIEGVNHIADELRMIERACGERMFLDGEFQVGGTLAATKAHCERGWRGGDAGHLYLFDALPREEWRRDACAAPLSARLARLAAAVASLPLRHVSVLPWALRGSAQAVLDDATAVWARNGEGLVVKLPSSVYRRSRAREWGKVKRVGVA